MSKTVTIPVGNEPFHCVINGVHYYYTSGSTVSVPDEVAALIQANAGNREEAENKSDIAIPRDGNTNDVLTRTATGAEWKAPATPTPELPSVSGSDNGKVLKVVEGAWAAASGGGSSGTMVVHDVAGTLDKTWQEIHDATANGVIPVISASSSEQEAGIFLVTFCGEDDGYFIGSLTCESGLASTRYYFTPSTDGYPVYDA